MRAPASPRVRVALALAAAAALWLVGGHVVGLDAGLLCMVPAFAIVPLLLAGRYPAEAVLLRRDRSRGSCRAAGSSSATRWQVARRPPERRPQHVFKRIHTRSCPTMHDHKIAADLGLLIALSAVAMTRGRVADRMRGAHR